MKVKFTSIVGRGLVALTVAFVLIAAANANAASNKKRTSGKLEITASTEVGGTLLEPGSYEFKMRNKKGVPVLEFGRWNYDPYAQEGLPVWDYEVVATVVATPQMLASPAGATELLRESPENSKAVALQIQGNDTKFGF